MTRPKSLNSSETDSRIQALDGRFLGLAASVLAGARVRAAASLPWQNALEHTQRTLAFLQPELARLPGEQAQALHLAALLHELGEAKAGGPRLPETGAARARDLLFRLDLPGPLRDEVVCLVRQHALPLSFGKRQAASGSMLRLAWTLDTRLLDLLATAHAEAGDLPPNHRRRQALVACRTRCRELGIYGREPAPLIPPQRWKRLAPADLRLQRQMAGGLRFWRLKGVFDGACGAEAWLRAQTRAAAGTLYLPVGVPGSGKSTWIAQHLPQARLISMDDRRERLTGDRGNQSRNAEVYRYCRSDLGRALRKGETVVWDAQNHTWAARQSLLALAREAQAYVVIVYFDLPLAVALERNAGRRAAVPEAIIVRSYDDLQEPRPFEAEELWRVDADGQHTRYVWDEATGA